MPLKKIPSFVFAAALSLTSVTPVLWAADAPAAATAPGDAAAAPAAPGAGRRGGGGGGGGRGNPMSDEDKAKLAKLADLPPWKPGVGEGDFRMVPNSTNTPPFSDTNPAYLPAPENTPRANVRKGRVEFFRLPL